MPSPKCHHPRMLYKAELSLPPLPPGGASPPSASGDEVFVRPLPIGAVRAKKLEEMSGGKGLNEVSEVTEAFIHDLVRRHGDLPTLPSPQRQVVTRLHMMLRASRAVAAAAAASACNSADSSSDSGVRLLRNYIAQMQCRLLLQNRAARAPTARVSQGHARPRPLRPIGIFRTPRIPPSRVLRARAEKKESIPVTESEQKPVSNGLPSFEEPQPKDVAQPTGWQKVRLDTCVTEARKDVNNRDPVTTAGGSRSDQQLSEGKEAGVDSKSATAGGDAGGWRLVKLQTVGSLSPTHDSHSSKKLEFVPIHVPRKGASLSYPGARRRESSRRGPAGLAPQARSGLKPLSSASSPRSGVANNVFSLTKGLSSTGKARSLGDITSSFSSPSLFSSSSLTRCSSSESSATSAPKFLWINPLTRIFLQDLPGEVPEASASTPASEALEGKNGSKGKVSVSSSSCSGSTDSPHHHSGGPTSAASSTASSSVGSSSTVSPLTGSGLGTNPFARSVAQPTWGTESSDHKPILAPPKLAPPPPDTGTSKSILQPSALGTRLGGGLIGGASSMFTPPMLTVTGVFPPQPMKPTFKLKPSVLSAPGGNPFTAPLPAEPDSKEDSTTVKEHDKDAKSEVCSEISSISSTTSSLISSSSTTTSSTIVTARASAASGSSASSTSPSLLASTAPSSALSSSKTISPTKEAAGSIALEKKIEDGGVDSSKNLFMPLSNSESKNEDSYKVNGVSSSTSSSFGPPGLQGSGNFIFGQNLHSRVVGADSAVTSSSEAATNGEKATGNLFSDAASELAKPSEDNPWGGKSLEELQQELAERESNQKRKFDEVEVITGEESESNVLQMNCKLYAWVSGTWQERGRGILRLNDWGEAEELHSRLVVRTQGTLTVMLNTKIWAEMSVERASTRSVRFTALDTEGQLKVFLVMGSPKDIDRLYNSLEWRVATSRTQTQDEVVASEVKKLKAEHYMSAAHPSSS